MISPFFPRPPFTPGGTGVFDHPSQDELPLFKRTRAAIFSLSSSGFGLAGWCLFFMINLLRKSFVFPSCLYSLVSFFEGKGKSKRRRNSGVAGQNMYRLLRYRVRSPPQFSGYALPLFGWCGYELFSVYQVSSPFSLFIKLIFKV